MSRRGEVIVAELGGRGILVGLEVGEARRVQISRATNHVRDLGGKVVNDLARSGSRGSSSIRLLEGRVALIPASGESARDATL